MNNARPSLRLLDAEQIQQVHWYTVRLLSTTGVRVDLPAVREALRQTGQVQIQDNRVKFSAEIIAQALASAPPAIQVYDRRGQPAFRPGADRLRFGVGPTALYYQEPAGDNLEVFTRHHLRVITRLGSRLPHYDVIATPGIVQDVPAALSDLYGHLDLLANTTKPLVVLTSDEDQLPPLLALYARLHGDLGAKPFVLPNSTRSRRW